MTAASTTVRKSPSRIEHREKMVEDIVAAAQAILAESGSDGLSMRILGRKVGVTAATLYGYFESKEAVLEELLARHMAGMIDAMTAASEGLPPGAARLFGFALGYRQFAQTTPDFFQMFVYKSEPLPWDESGIQVQAQDRHALSYLYSETEEAIARDEMFPTNVGSTCLTLWSIAHGYVALEANNCFDTRHMSEEEQLATYMQYLRVASPGLFTPLGFARIAEFFDGIDVGDGERTDG